MGQYVGYLPQDIELLDGTIAENIARFSEVDSDKVVEAAKRAGVHEVILKFADGYDTYIGEGGVILSGGQRQRIALARAVYGDPVMIVLDEPNSNLDEIGEAALVETLKKLKALGKTVVVITHRTQILSAVDKILVMAAGTPQMYGPRNDVLGAMQKQAQERAQAMQAAQAAQQQQAKPAVQTQTVTAPIKL
jgi:ABC-type protease/lipase transport system fused ATPase/permease subunit